MGVLATAALLVPALPASATVSLTPDVTGKVVGGVYGLAHYEAADPAQTRTFLGGQFTGVGGTPRSNVAALKADGKVDPAFNPGADGRVKAVAVSEDGSMVFLGGLFQVVGGEPRANLAAVDADPSSATYGEVLLAWTADTTGTNPDVSSLAVHGDRLYVGGRFTGIDGTTSRKRLVAIDIPSGNLITSFRPAPNKGVTEVVVSPDGTVYAGGSFTMLGGQPRNSAGSVLAATGTATGFAPTGNGGNVVTVGLSPDGGRFFYGTENNTLFAYDPAISNNPVWLIKTSGNTQAIAVSDDELWIGGHFSQIVTTHDPRPFIASIDPVDGSVNAWNPNCFGGKMGVWALLLEGTHLHARRSLLRLRQCQPARVRPLLRTSDSNGTSKPNRSSLSS